MDSFEAFLDDYFAESDEHLAGARRTLLALESALGKPGAERAPLEELFRIFHSIKGISAMVELRPAEQLAHELEDYLRALRQREVALTAEGIDLLIDGVMRLEQVIGARKESAASPSIDDVVARAAGLSAAAGARPGSGPPDAADATPRREQWLALFQPSRDLLARGIGVDLVRRRLGEIGDIISAAPHIGQDGSIQFQFVVAIPGGEPATVPLQELGIRFERTGAADVGERSEVADEVEAPAMSAVAPSHFVRVDLTRLDELMRNVGDLVISRARLADSLARVESHVPPLEWRAVHENATAIDRQLRSLREGIMRVRLVPVGEIFRRMPFVVRDLARSMGKRVELQLLGQATEIDKYVIERMMDPVLHLVRNSVTHGIETPDERTAAGKSPEGTLTLSASTAGDVVTIEIADDGRGIDAEAVAARARAVGIPVPAQLDNAALLAIICSPGFSTREESDRGAGRGVGMAVVKTTAEQLSGTVSLETQPGAGTRFTISLPLTLAITDALIVRVGSETFAVPQGAVREVLEVFESSVKAFERHEIIPYRGGVLPIVRLARLFGVEQGTRPDRFHLFVVGYSANAVGVAVDRIIGQREVVVRSIADPLVRVDGISGATDLGDGHVVLILDPSAIARLMGQQLAVRPFRVEAS